LFGIPLVTSPEALFTVRFRSEQVKLNCVRISTVYAWVLFKYSNLLQALVLLLQYLKQGTYSLQLETTPAGIKNSTNTTRNSLRWRLCGSGWDPPYLWEAPRAWSGTEQAAWHPVLAPAHVSRAGDILGSCRSTLLGVPLRYGSGKGFAVLGNEARMS